MDMQTITAEPIAENVKSPIRPARATPLNVFDPLKRNFYVLSYSLDEVEFFDEALTDHFNFIHLYFDIHNSCKTAGGPHIIMDQLVHIIKNDRDAVVLGHSCNGYIAHQLASVMPQISHCVIVDAFNEFKKEDYVRKNALISLAANLYRQVIKNRDPGYPLSLARHFLRNLRKPKIAYDLGVREGAESFYREVQNYPAMNDCIFFRATRSSMSNPEHGPNWRPYVKGVFHLIPVKADHVAIKEHRKEIAGHIIRIAFNKN
jgi:hypothetical protein